ncbi:MAG: hypothetical protein FJ279_05780 [Planctomycetes bacterium]|nr:hypothetical protein [Planctomycetota bacterium]MBM4081313.1 hypothetical protein [Planctomycetota bacterium]MBM4083235.1 hypothetical protein [Planctomycetota bacterium]
MLRSIEKLILAAVILAILAYVGYEIFALRRLDAQHEPIKQRITAVQKRLAENPAAPISPDPMKCSAKVKADWSDLAATASFNPWTFYEAPAGGK